MAISVYSIKQNLADIIQEKTSYVDVLEVVKELTQESDDEAE